MLDNEIQFVDSVLDSPLTEAVVMGFDAIFEAKHGMIGKILTRLAHRVADEYAIPMDEAKKLVVQLQRITMDQFAPLKGVDENGNPYKPETQAEFKAMMTKYFTKVLTMLCDDMGYVLKGNRHVKTLLDKFYIAFGYMVRNYDDDFDGNLVRRSTGEQYDAERIIDEFYEPALEAMRAEYMERVESGDGDIDSSVMDDDGNEVDGVRSGEYTIVHIPTGHEAEGFGGTLPCWCICENPEEYWNRYSANGENKCYFLLRDDFKEPDTNAGPGNLPFKGGDDNSYGRSAIGLFVNHGGQITDMFNRNNVHSMPYTADDLSILLGGKFTDLCPGYGPDEGIPYDGMVTTSILAGRISNTRKSRPDLTPRQVIAYALDDSDPNHDHQVYGTDFLVFNVGPVPETTYDYEYDEDGDETYEVENDHWGEEYEDSDGNMTRYNIYDVKRGRLMLADWADSVKMMANGILVEIGGSDNVLDLQTGKWKFRDWVSRTEYDDYDLAIGRANGKFRIYDNRNGDTLSNWVNGSAGMLPNDPGYMLVGTTNVFNMRERRMLFHEPVTYVNTAYPITKHFIVIRDLESTVELVDCEGNTVPLDFDCLDVNRHEFHVDGIYSLAKVCVKMSLGCEYGDMYRLTMVGTMNGPMLNTIILDDRHGGKQLFPWSQCAEIVSGGANKFVFTVMNGRTWSVYDADRNLIHSAGSKPLITQGAGAVTRRVIMIGDTLVVLDDTVHKIKLPEIISSEYMHIGGLTFLNGRAFSEMGLLGDRLDYIGFINADRRAIVMSLATSELVPLDRWFYTTYRKDVRVYSYDKTNWFRLVDGEEVPVERYEVIYAEWN